MIWIRGYRQRHPDAFLSYSLFVSQQTLSSRAIRTFDGMIPTLFFSFIVFLVDAHQHFDSGTIRSAMKRSGTFIVHTTTPPSSFVLHSMIYRWPDINVHIHLSRCILFRSKSISPFFFVRPHGYCWFVSVQCLINRLSSKGDDHLDTTEWTNRLVWFLK